jgi:hypothetical protein
MVTLPGVPVRLGADFDEFVRVSSGPLLRTGYLLIPDRQLGIRAHLR